MKARAIAFYLPQFHPIPENDEWWGKGFTEWTNVTKAKPLFPGHYQPHLPADLGFYDLRVPEVREAQADMARAHGIEGFCYWHYWFAGDRLLERPFDEVLASGKPDFPFCLAWANHTWNGMWSGGDEKKVIKEQTYPGREDEKAHFEYLLKAFRDKRYIRVDGKPLFVIYRPLEIPDCRGLLEYWRGLALSAGLPGLHLIANLDYHERNWPAVSHGFDGITIWALGRVLDEQPPLQFAPESTFKRLLWRLKRTRFHKFIPSVHASRKYPERLYDYPSAREKLICHEKFEGHYIPMTVPKWDTAPRYKKNAIILNNSSPEAFKKHFSDVVEQVQINEVDKKIVFIKSWNEWAEGNCLEPDQRHGNGYLEAAWEVLQ
jgi:lipopolysaccharide biosynthesis protein